MANSHNYSEGGMAYMDRRAAALVALFLLCPSASVAQSSSITPEQRQVLQQFSSRDPALLQLIESGLKSSRRREEADVEPGGEDTRSTARDVRDVRPLGQQRDGDAPPRLRPGDTVLLRFEVRPPGGDARGKSDAPAPDPKAQPRETTEKLDEQQKLREAMLPPERLFVLDQFGGITMKNIGRVALSGLNEDEAAERIAAEPVFQGMQVVVRLLPLEKELKPFGYDIFAGSPRTFAPATNIPVPPDYVVGPGDTVVVQMFGKDNAEHELAVTRDGLLLFPGIGPIPVAGMKFPQMQKEIHDRVQRQMIGARASVSLGRLRSIRVFVLGDVEHPGSYTVSGLSTLTNALIASGGVKPFGSLRDVQLKRSGKIVTRLDAYQLLLRGDSSGDARLLPGDVIFVPPAGPTAGIGGRVRRPAIYELKDEKTLAELIELAGGLLPDADVSAVLVERIAHNRVRTVTGADLAQPEMRNTELRDGDIVRVYPVADTMEESVSVSGHVQRPGGRPWRTGFRLTNVIPSIAHLRPDADPRYILVTRTNPTDGTTELIGADLLAAIERPESEANIVLAPRDSIRVFDLHEDRATLIKPMLAHTRASTSPTRPVREVSVEGAVHHPGLYPWSPTMRMSDLLAAAGGLTDRAYTLEAELTRFVFTAGKAREQARRVVDLAQVGGESNIPLEPYDQLVVRRIPKWEEAGVIEIQGEVKFPGKYPIARGERLSRIIQRAGGLTTEAYPKAAVFLRESVRQREQEYLERLAAQLERDLGIVSIEGADIGVKKEAALAEGHALLRQMRAAKAVGRMVVNLDAVLDVREGYDLVVQPGDKLHIPQRPEEVMVLGEVYHPTSHLYAPNLDRNSYVRLSGGITERGNKRAVYVVHADGAVTPPGGWFGGNADIGPGDTVIVPLKVDRISKLKLFTDISTVLFQLAVTAAALDAIGIL